MNREIKFRAFYNGKMRYDIDSIILIRGEVNSVLFEDDMEAYIEKEGFVAFPTCILMQYTGLKDKNGKEIYEGDILQIKLNDGKIGIFVVKYNIHRRKMDSGWVVDIPSFSFVSVTNGFPTYPIVNNYAGKHDLDIIEVIGNIHENPELLKINNK